jgi:MFS transporter, OFA family, oxalate/formate antiporter
MNNYIESRYFNRWFVVIGAVMIQVALGAIYAWSVFTTLLTDPAGDYGFSASQTAWIFSSGLATFAIVMVLAGRWQAQVGPTRILLLGGLTLGMGYVLGGLFGGTFWAQLFFIGIVGGAGIGLAYVVPIAVGIKWFPDRKGVITGLAVAGFGFGATLWVKMADSWFGGLLNMVTLFNLPPVQSVFVVYGIAFATLIGLGSLVVVNPPAGYRPQDWTAPDTSSQQATGAVNYEWREMLRTPQFYLLWLLFFFSALAGLMVIYCIRLFGVDALAHHQIANPGVMAGTAMAWYAIFNGLGRIAWGSLSDKIGRKHAIFSMLLLQGVVMLAFYHAFITFASTTGFIVAASLIGFNFGGNFALFPAATADYFGNDTVGSNYGWVFSAYGIAGIAGPQLAGRFHDAASAAASPIIWMPPFIIAGAVCLVGALLAEMARPPKVRAVAGA